MKNVRLSESRLGRVWLHVRCALRDRHWRWHWNGIWRELFRPGPTKPPAV